MPSKMKDLYMAESINELKEKSMPGSISILEKRSPEMLLKSADKLYIEARKAQTDGDEERAYVMFMRSMEIFNRLRKSTTTEKMKQITTQNLRDSIIQAEKLIENLGKRYQELQQSKDLLQNDSTQIPSLNSLEEIEVASSYKQLQATSPDDSLSCIGLHSLITGGKESLIIMDVRSASDYTESHMIHSCCINVPQDILRLGSAATCIGKLLPEKSLQLWEKRSLVDYVILMDWNSSSNNIVDNSPISILQNAIIKWDPNTTYKSLPFIVNGGYESWILSYPAETSNSKFTKIVSTLPAVMYNDSLKSVHYNVDELNEGFIERKDQSLSEENLSNIEYIDNEENSKQVEFTHIPRVDRSSKPKALNKLNVKVYDQYNDGVNGKPRIAWNSPTDKEMETQLVFEEMEKASNDEFQNSINLLSKEEDFEKICERISRQADEDMLQELKAEQEANIKRLRELEDERDRYKKNSTLLEQENSKLKEQCRGQDYSARDILVQKFIKKQQLEKERRDAEIAKLREKRKKEEHISFKNNVLESSKSETTIIQPSRNVSPATVPNIKINDEHVEQLKSEPKATLKTGLSRSHSSPNINELVDDENRKPPFKLEPSINRALKPSFQKNKSAETSAARQRNLNPVYSSHGKGKAGLRNLGNTCYMNSVIQCLHSTASLRDYLISKEYLRDINKYNKEGTQGRIIEELSVIVGSMSNGNYRFISPTDFKNTVSQYMPMCIGYDQQDAHEFLTYLMEKLHGDINIAANTQKQNHPDVEKMIASRATDIFWKWHTTYNNSKVVDLFEGIIQSKLICKHCQAESNNYEVFSCLSVPIPSQLKCTLNECIESLLKAEKICGEAAWSCPNCKQKREAEKRMIICKLPVILIIHLKRFSYNGLWRQKLQTHVNFPIEELDMRPYLLEKDSNSKYQAYGVVNHYGTMEGGHYTAYCRNIPNDQWLKCDDQDISNISSGGVKTNAAYILFYSSLAT